MLEIALGHNEKSINEFTHKRGVGHSDQQGHTVHLFTILRWNDIVKYSKCI